MLLFDWYVKNRIWHELCRTVTLDADWARQDTRLTSRVLPAQSASRVTVRHRMNMPDSLYLLSSYQLIRGVDGDASNAPTFCSGMFAERLVQTPAYNLLLTK